MTQWNWVSEALHGLMNQDLLKKTVYLDETFVLRLESKNKGLQVSKKQGIND